MLLLIDSRDKSNSTDSNANFTINLQNQISNVNGIKLKKTMMNHIIYNISSEYNNNLFEFTELGTDIQFQITSGYYTPSQLCTHMTTALNSETLNAYIYSVTYSSVTYKFTISATSNFDLPVSTLGDYMGFASALSGASSYTSDISNITDPNYLYLSLQFIPQTGVSSSNIYYNFVISSDNEQSEYNGIPDYCVTFAQPQNIKTFTVTLKNRDGSLVQTCRNYAFLLDLNVAQ
jgi:hypothetical protein